MTKLNEISINKSYIIEDIFATDKTRLMELGLVKGAIILKTHESMDKKMIGIKVKGSTIGIRTSLGKSILVKEVVF